MSTSYRIRGLRRITYAKLSRSPFTLRVHPRDERGKGIRITHLASWRAAVQATHDPNVQAHITCELDGDFLHLDVTPAGNVNGWTRYGGNNAGPFLEWLEDEGIDWCDEHDDDYYP